MSIRIFASMAMAAVVALTAATSNAGYFTTNGSVELSALPALPGTNPNSPGPPLVTINELGLPGGGRAFTNQVSGAAFSPGGTIRTVGAIQIGTAINGTTFPAVLPDGSPAHILFAVEGTITEVGTAFHTGGSFWIVGEGASTFVAVDPGTWNFAGAVAKYDLAPPGDIIDGAGLGISSTFPTVGIPGSTVNFQNIEGLGGNTTGNGVFVFLEDPNFSPAFDIFGTGAQNGPEFLYDVEAPTLPQPAAIQGEGFVAITDQALLNAPNDFDAFDAIFNAIFASAYNVTGPFSEGGYNPTTPGTTGDIFTDFGSELAVIATVVVPEPGSWAIFAIGICGAGVVRASRRRRLSSK